MKNKTEKREGAALDAAVVLALGLVGNLNDGRAGCHMIPFDTGPSESSQGDTFEPSTRWEHGGPIIERERISVSQYDRNPVQWFADVDGCWSHDYIPGKHTAFGPTQLIAAMRVYVASKFGEEVDLP